jgi:crotonobetainyl-CoA:carnitine CoA-transferase CaiB-like acyl-CoA transferase
MRTPEGQDIVRRLALDCDVFLENNRPGVMQKIGLDGQALKATNPDIIYVSVSGYGQTGPFRSRGVVNLIAEAASGMLSVSGEPGKMPMRPGIQTADLFGALFATYAVLAALVGRSRFGEGRIADVSLIEASVAAAAWEAAGYLATGEIPGPIGNSHRLNAPYQIFSTKDGRYIALLAALNLSEHAKDERFSSYSKRKQNETAIVAIVDAAVSKWDAEPLEAALIGAGVPCSIVKNYKEVFEDPNMVSRNILGTVHHPKLGDMKVVRNPVLFDVDGPTLSSPAPLLGQHTVEILKEHGYSDERIDALEAAGVITQNPEIPIADSRASSARARQ